MPHQVGGAGDGAALGCCWIGLRVQGVEWRSDPREVGEGVEVVAVGGVGEYERGLKGECQKGKCEGVHGGWVEANEEVGENRG